MVKVDEISRLQQQLTDAETDLRESLSEVNQKVEAVDVKPRIEKLIREHPFASASLAVAAGFALAGSRVASRARLLGALALGVFLGYRFASQPEEEGGPES